MTITNEDLIHLASLSDFSLSQDEMESLKIDLDNIVNYISKLDELNTEGIEPTFTVSPLENVFRSDEIQNSQTSREDLLALTKNELTSQIKVPKVL